MKGDTVSSLPTITSASKRIQGTIKQRPDDFTVTEIPLYEMEGAGPHLYMKLTKRGLTTDRAIKIMADYFDVDTNRFGVAGRKDKRAVTTQRISLEHADPEDVKDFDHNQMELEVVDWHRNKLRRGHLEGNRFSVKLRDLNGEPPDEHLNDTLNRLRNKGLPNYFGPQRFGRRGDTATLGKNLLHDELDRFIKNYLGNPMEEDPPAVHEARNRFEQNRLEDAMDVWPKSYGDKRRALATYIDRGAPGPVLSAISKSKRQLFVSAYQSQLFNEILAKRMPDIDQLYRGDIAKKTDTGGLFEVEDAEIEQPRADKFDISPTGLLPGLDPWKTSGKPGRMEKTVMDRHNLTSESFEKVGYLNVNGTRRPLRVQPGDLNWEYGRDQHGSYCQFEFVLPSGSYATVFLREVAEFTTNSPSD
jgi:tRNA pseudouridine13 synthase